MRYCKSTCKQRACIYKLLNIRYIPLKMQMALILISVEVINASMLIQHQIRHVHDKPDHTVERVCSHALTLGLLARVCDHTCGISLSVRFARSSSEYLFCRSAADINLNVLLTQYTPANQRMSHTLCVSENAHTCAFRRGPEPTPHRRSIEDVFNFRPLNNRRRGPADRSINILGLIYARTAIQPHRA